MPCGVNGSCQIIHSIRNGIRQGLKQIVPRTAIYDGVMSAAKNACTGIRDKVLLIVRYP